MATEARIAHNAGKNGGVSVYLWMSWIHAGPGLGMVVYDRCLARTNGRQRQGGEAFFVSGCVSCEEAVVRHVVGGEGMYGVFEYHADNFDREFVNGGCGVARAEKVREGI